MMNSRRIHVYNFMTTVSSRRRNLFQNFFMLIANFSVKKIFSPDLKYLLGSVLWSRPNLDRIRLRPMRPAPAKKTLLNKLNK